jgi:hypothetical protein
MRASLMAVPPAVVTSQYALPSSAAQLWRDYSGRPLAVFGDETAAQHAPGVAIGCERCRDCPVL